MTTAHKPTYHPAVGSSSVGGYRFHAPLRQYSAKDQSSHATLKIRQIGQNSVSELRTRDLRAELEEREAKHFKEVYNEKKRQGLLPFAEKQPELAKLQKNVDWSKFDDSDDTDNDDSDDSDSDDDEEDEEAELMAELERIKKERAEEARKKEEAERLEQEEQQNAQILAANPLLNASSFSLKRRWDEDVVFKNQSKDETKVKKRFINDTLRSDFHRNFLKKYVQ
mmetsp:Transcript_130/g.253  ORF Transcript_130/g.253 Transcript_130/m.253 type:complete len:224 (-) Transcript_130:347-1018(-)|eukprot:CAMPEP_0175139650 /NCGR_PEP_ID=MMETSP0087-20121206/11028_1 /TAXON_ID=136419 /ORGANISM="Unknown Unknown, Strain D1" /LENGTH=223 /DNA_ID=CAMNT_0016422699 /DNA_START=29 /DNA_END=700 /DNA_ORIENTATION=+